MMKIYQVVMSYFDGDHDHGSYCSPMFSTKELAEAFFADLVATEDQEKKWWTEDWGSGGDAASNAHVYEKEIREEWKSEDLQDVNAYLVITYT